MAGKIYNLGNSRSPMLFRKKKNKAKDMSRSLDDLMSSSFDKDNGGLTASGVEWPELASVKKVGPVIMCILPPFSADFVCSALLSLGATPLITDSKYVHELAHRGYAVELPLTIANYYCLQISKI